MSQASRRLPFFLILAFLNVFPACHAAARQEPPAAAATASTPRSLPKAEDFMTLDEHNKAGIIALQQKEYAQALELFQTLLPRSAAVNGTESLQYAHILHNLGSTYKYMGKVLEACHYYREAARIKALVLGSPAHPQVARSLEQYRKLIEPWIYQQLVTAIPSWKNTAYAHGLTALLGAYPEEEQQTILEALGRGLASYPAEAPFLNTLGDYFLTVGRIYLDVLEHLPAEEWLTAFMKNDLVCQLNVMQDEVWQLRFGQAMSLVEQRYGAEDVQRILIGLQKLALAEPQVNPYQICHLLELLPELDPSQQPATLLHTTAQESLVRLYTLLLLEANILLSATYLVVQQAEQQGVTPLLLHWLTTMHQPWGGGLFDQLVQMANPDNPKELGDFLYYVHHGGVSALTLRRALTVLQEEGADVPLTLTNWQTAISYTVLIEYLEEQLPVCYHAQVAPVVWQLLLAAAADKKNALNWLTPQSLPEFSFVTLLLVDYQPPATSYPAIVELLQTTPPDQWNDKLREQLLATTFGPPHVHTAEELLAIIAANAKAQGGTQPGLSLLLEECYKQVQQAYQRPSLLTGQGQNALPICQWGTSQLSTWATKFREAGWSLLPERSQPQASAPYSGVTSASGYFTAWRELQAPPSYSGACKARIAESVAVMRRAVKLHLGYEPREVQLLALLSLLLRQPTKGRLLQINTGEGKSLLTAMLAVLQALQGYRVDCITSSTELSRPQAKTFKPFYQLFNLTVGENSGEPLEAGLINRLFKTKESAKARREAKRQAYTSNIVYGTPSEFEADLLQREFFGDDDIMPPLDYSKMVLIVDEVDHMLVNERSHATKLVTPLPGMHHLRGPMVSVWHLVQELNKQIVTLQGQLYYVNQPFKQNGDEITLLADVPLEEALVPIEDKQAFIKGELLPWLKECFRKPSMAEKTAWEAYQRLETKREELERKLAEAAADPNPPAHRDSELEYHEEQGWITNSKPALNWQWMPDHKKRRSLEWQLAKCKNEMSESPWVRKHYTPFVAIPKHLHDYVLQEFPAWLDSALMAQYVYRKEFHYDVVHDKIVPIDYVHTGVLQQGLVWQHGLSFFLALKEGLPIHPDSLSTNLMSNVAFFARYGQNLYGFTGTLGPVATRSFLEDVYKVDTLVIPGHCQRTIAGHGNRPFSCKEFPPLTSDTIEGWCQAVYWSIVAQLYQQRAVLVLCPYIALAKGVANLLKTTGTSCQLHTYTGQEAFAKTRVDIKDVILATNIAGRGTDLVTSPELEANGGLHVCLTFLPSSTRVEIQNIGRTARAGKWGSCQLVLYHSTPASVEFLRIEREEREYTAMQRARREVRTLLCQDRLFRSFCQVLRRTFVDEKTHAQRMLTASVAASWKAQLTELKKHEKELEESYKKQASLTEQQAEAEINKLLEEKYEDNSLMGQLADWWNPEAKRDKIRNDKAAIKRNHEQIWRQAHQDGCKAMKAQAWASFVKLVQEDCEDSVPTQDLEEIRAQKWKGYKKPNWGRAMRAALEERWGLWLQQMQPYFDQERGADLAEDDSDQKNPEAPKNPTLASPLDPIAAVEKAFDEFLDELEGDLAAGKPAKNPYYYVLEGNHCLNYRLEDEALAYYERAAAMDPVTAPIALYRQAYLLCHKGSGIAGGLSHRKQARDVLQKAGTLLREQSLPDLLRLGLETDAANKPKLQEQITQETILLSLIQQYIEDNYAVLKEVVNEEKRLHAPQTRSLVKLFRQQNGEEEKEDEALIDGTELPCCLEEVEICGLSGLFFVSPKPAIPWKSLVGMTSLSLVQLVGGTALVVFAPGAGSGLGYFLLQEGVSDLLNVGSIANSGEFSWKDWSVQKAISASLSGGAAGLSAYRTARAAELAKKGAQSGNFFQRQLRYCKGASDILLQQTRATIQEAAWVGGHFTSSFSAARLANNVGVQGATSSLFTKTTTEGLQLMGKQMLFSVLEQGGHYLVSHLVYQTYTEHVLPAIHNLVHKQLRNKLCLELEQQLWVIKALSLDVQQSKTTWYTILEGTGIQLLVGQEAAWITAGESIATRLLQLDTLAGQGESQDKKAKKKFNVPQAIKLALSTIRTVLDSGKCVLLVCNFSKDFTTKLACRQDDIAEQIQEKFHTWPPRLGVPKGVSKQVSHLATTFADELTCQIDRQLQQHFAIPLLQRGVNAAMRRLPKCYTDYKQRLHDDICKFHYKIIPMQAASALERQPAAKPEKIAPANKKTQPAPVAQPEEEKLASVIADATAEGTEQGGIVHLGSLATALGRPVLIYNKAGELDNAVGAHLAGKPLAIRYIPPDTQTNTPGHWEPLDGREVTSTGETNCLFDTLAALTGEHNGEELRQLAASHLRQNAHVLRPYVHTLHWLSFAHPDALYAGEGLLRTAIVTFMKIEATWEEFCKNYPRLAKCLEQTYYVAGVGICIGSAFVTGGVSAAAQRTLTVLVGMGVGAIVEYTMEKFLDPHLNTEEAELAIANYLRNNLDPDLSEEEARYGARKVMSCARELAKAGLRGCVGGLTGKAIKTKTTFDAKKMRDARQRDYQRTLRGKKGNKGVAPCKARVPNPQPQPTKHYTPAAALKAKQQPKVLKVPVDFDDDKRIVRIKKPTGDFTQQSRAKVKIKQQIPPQTKPQAKAHNKQEQVDRLANARELGRKGELRAGIDPTKKKARLKINGRTRIPDDSNDYMVKEVKNCETQSYSQQLRDFAQHCEEEGKEFILQTRPDTKLSVPLQQQISQGKITHKHIPWLPTPPIDFEPT